MKEMIEHIVKALVDHPDEVKVTELAGERTLTYEVKVVQGDQGKGIARLCSQIRVDPVDNVEDVRVRRV